MFVSTLLRNRSLHHRFLSTKAVKHVVMFGLRADADKQGIQAALLSLPASIPQIQTHELGVDLQLPAGQRHPAGPNRSLSWTVTFANTKDYLTYDTHPDHQHVVSLIKEGLVPGTRAAIQYEIEG